MVTVGWWHVIWKITHNLLCAFALFFFIIEQIYWCAESGSILSISWCIYDTEVQYDILFVIENLMQSKKIFFLLLGFIQLLILFCLLVFSELLYRLKMLLILVFIESQLFVARKHTRGFPLNASRQTALFTENIW